MTSAERSALGAGASRRAPVTAFDADVIIYAASPDHPARRRIRALFDEGADDSPWAIGSVLLNVETLAKPLRRGPGSKEARVLRGLLDRLDLMPFTAKTADIALVLAISYGVRAADAVHLATAVECGADRFLTNNRKDFPKSISELDIIYPEDLPDTDADR